MLIEPNACPPPTPHAPRPRAPWTTPAIEKLPPLRMMTLQQSVPVGPGGFLLDGERTTHLA
jgi:hypothetical protein